MRYASYRYRQSFPTRRSSDLCPAVLVDAGDRLAVDLRGRVAQLVALAGGPPGPRPLHVPALRAAVGTCQLQVDEDRKSTRLNSSHMSISYAVFCLKKKNPILI